MATKFNFLAGRTAGNVSDMDRAKRALEAKRQNARILGAFDAMERDVQREVNDMRAGIEHKAKGLL